jgi:hypothetical protein
MTPIIDPERAFNHNWPDPPPEKRGNPDPEPRLQGDILIRQAFAAWTPTPVKQVIWVTYGVTRLCVWDLPKFLVEWMITEPLRRRRKRQHKREE